MSRIKPIDADSIDAVDLAPSATIEFEGIVINLLMEFLSEQKNGAPCHTAMHDHSAYELVIGEEGSAEFLIEDETLTLNSGEFILIAPHTRHKVLTYTSGMRRFCLRFKIKSDAHHISIAPSKYLSDTLSQSERAHIFSIISELRKLTDAPLAAPAAYRMRAQFGIILSYILERLIDMDISTTAQTSSQISLHSKIENYLYLNYSQNITLESLAAYLSYSRTQTQRIVEDCFGMPFTKKLREIRLSAAKNLLSDSELSIDAIAEKCGYETRQGFEAMFQKHIGITPNQYRRQNQK